MINNPQYKPYILYLFCSVLFSVLFLGASLSRSTAHATTQGKAMTTWTICSVNCDFTTMQTAINHSQVVNGDTLFLKEAGPHTEPNILVDKNLTIEGISAPFSVIQAADSVANSTNRIFNIVDGVDVTIQNITIRHGHTSGNEVPDSFGGGIRSGTGDLTLIDVLITDNEATGNGGGIYNQAGTLTIHNGFVTENKAGTSGGGISSHGSLMMSQTELAGVTKNESRRGGGIYHIGGPLSLSQVIISNNKVRNQGGGLYIISTQAMLDHVRIGSNQSGVTDSSTDPDCAGAGIYNRSPMTISNSEIIHNAQMQCDDADGDGGGIMHDTILPLTILNSWIANNRAYEWGAGLYSRGPLHIEQSTVIRNEGAGSTDKLFASGIAHTGPTLTMKDVTLQDNKDGVAIYVSSSTTHVTLDHVDISGTQNDSGRGGGIWIENGYLAKTVLIHNSTIQENESRSGGGIYASNLSDTDKPLNITIDHSRIMSNTAHINSNNIPEDGQGGGLWMRGTVLTVTNSLVSGNYAENHGGGMVVNGQFNGSIVIPYSRTRIMNSTISGNSTLENGGGIYVDSHLAQSIALLHSTISNNTADVDGNSGANGGGIYKKSTYYGAYLHNTIIAGNYDPRPNLVSSASPDCDGDFQTINHDVTQGDTVLIGTLGFGGFSIPPLPPPCEVTGGGVQTDVSVADLDLEPLHDNGGDTLTHALGANSIAVRTGQTACSLYDVSIDQRGYERVNQCDIGAYEFGGVMPVPTPTPTPSVTITPINTPQPVPTATPTLQGEPGSISIYLPLVIR